MTTLVVIAKACVPGRVKTRLHPPLTLEDAARVAAASLADTLDALAGANVERRVLFFDGDPASVPPDARAYEVVPQPSGTLDVRIGWILDHVAGPLLLVGMDTPQVTVEHVGPALAALDGEATLFGAALSGDTSGVTRDAWLGPASDGGYWALGLPAWPVDTGRGRRGDLVRGVPMSRDDTGARQREQLESAGLHVRTLDELTDVDTAADLWSVARRAPGSRTARAVRGLPSVAPDITSRVASRVGSRAAS